MSLPCVNLFHFQLCFCQILFELVYSWESYHNDKKGELFVETQCSSTAQTVNPSKCNDNTQDLNENISCYQLMHAYMQMMLKIYSVSQKSSPPKTFCGIFSPGEPV